MARIGLSFSSVVPLSLLAVSLLPAWAGHKQPNDYPLTGKVLAIASKGAHFYQVATDTRVYLLMCEKVKGLHMGRPECKVDDFPIAVGDTLKFRLDDDWVYLPEAKNAEDGLRILTMEFKTIPPLPKPTAVDTAKDPNSSVEHAMVIGSGMHIKGQKAVGWATNPSSVGRPGFGMGAPAPGIAMASPSAPVMATGPVMAVPVTGGAPVMVMPTGPTGGGMVTGIPVTGGAPVIGMATGPVMGTPVGGARAGAPFGGGGGGGGPPPWVHILRIQTDKQTIMLECSSAPCQVDKKPLGLGDTLAIRVEKKWAYVLTDTETGSPVQKFKILSETEDDAPADTK